MIAAGLAAAAIISFTFRRNAAGILFLASLVWFVLLKAIGAL